MTKKELRAAMRRKNLGITPSERAAASGRIFAPGGAFGGFRQGPPVGVFCSLADEPDTSEALARWSAAGRRLAVPRVEGDVMRFYEYDPRTMRPGAFGIAEPGPEARLCEPPELDLVIVPGTAFTAAGARMGRGRGYYDKYLAQPEVHAVKIGVCYAHQLVGELPSEPHDVAMDCVITD